MLQAEKGVYDHSCCVTESYYCKEFLEILEKWAGVPTEVHVASEFVYNMPLLSEKPLFIYISQSGETADSRAVLVETKN